jgi:hypothetical protein
MLFLLPICCFCFDLHDCLYNLCAGSFRSETIVLRHSVTSIQYIKADLEVQPRPVITFKKKKNKLSRMASEDKWQVHNLENRHSSSFKTHETNPACRDYFSRIVLVKITEGKGGGGWWRIKENYFLYLIIYCNYGEKRQYSSIHAVLAKFLDRPTRSRILHTGCSYTTASNFHFFSLQGGGLEPNKNASSMKFPFNVYVRKFIQPVWRNN